MAAMQQRAETLEDAARQDMLVIVRCRACGHAASFLAADLALAAPASRRLARLRFRCRECGAEDCSVEAEELDRPRRAGIVVWRPTRLR